MARCEESARPERHHESGGVNLLRSFLQIWKLLGNFGLRHADRLIEKKLLRLHNRLVFFSIIVVMIQTINFWQLGLRYILLVNGVILASYVASLVFNTMGWQVFSRVFFFACAFVGIAHHHLYFGFGSGFWLLLFVVSQGAFVLFPDLKTRQLLTVGATTAAAIIALVVWSVNFPPLYDQMTSELAARFFRNNLIRSPILLVLIAYYLVDGNRKAEEILAFSAGKATAATQAKSLFLSNISHELRTPMNAVKGFTDILVDLTQTLSDQKAKKQYTEYLNQIQISAANLTSIIDDILDFARIETNRIIFREQDFDLHDLAKNVMQTAQFYEHKSRFLETVTEFSDNLPHHAKGDPVRLSQILLNLVGNAMKFTHQGHVILRISVLEETEIAYQICFEVEDTGIGIPGEKLPYLFDSFSQVSKETAVRYGGTGLGLAISKHLIELQGGTIAVMSSPNKGSLFTVTLWFGKILDAEKAGNAVHRDLKRKRILVAEDNEVNQILVRTLLESWNAEIEIVEDGLKALGRAQTGSYDLILMDLQMPFMDGLEACENIRAFDDKVKAAIPIVALTADVLMETRKKVFAVGMNDIVTKPINQAELYAAIKKVLKDVEGS